MEGNMAHHIVRLGVITIGMIAIAGCCPPSYYNKPYSKIPSIIGGDVPTIRQALERIRYNEKIADIIDERVACHDPSECGGQPDVHLRIIPSARANYIDWKRALSTGSGRTLAKISNMENVPFGPLHLMPNETAYLWIGETTAGKRNVGLFAERNGKYEFIKEAIQLRYCNYARPATAAVHFHNPPQCKDMEPTATPARGEIAQPVRLASNANVSDLDLTRAFIHNQALWISCSSGCCEASFAQAN